MLSLETRVLQMKSFLLPEDEHVAKEIQKENDALDARLIHEIDLKTTIEEQAVEASAKQSEAIIHWNVNTRKL